MRIRPMLACLVVVAAWRVALAQNAPPAAVLFQNVRVFDGKSDALSAPTNVLVRGNTIDAMSAQPIPATRTAGATVIAGGGRTLMPGLIDAHWHTMMAITSPNDLPNSDMVYLSSVAGRGAQETLLRGFTSVRDMSGPSFGLKKAIDQGVIQGPRIWPSGALISQTGGHGDYRSLNELPRLLTDQMTFLERENFALVADSPDQVRVRVREQLMRGASQVKLAAGAGVVSTFDPLDVTEFTEAEIRAAVEAADNWYTYVAVHVYTPRAVQIAIRAGVKSIEHGQLIDDATAKIMAEKGIWLSLQPFLNDEDAMKFPPGSASEAKLVLVSNGTDTAYGLAKKYKLKTAFGTDTVFDARLATRQGAQLAKLVRWYTPAEVLRMGTRDNAQLLALSGPRNPYPGTLGIVETGALADLLLVDGDPLANINLIADPAKNFLVIMKDGKVYKNAVPAQR